MQAAVDVFLKNRAEEVRRFTDIESGRKNDRSELQAAIAYCKAHRAVFLIAKLDRLTRMFLSYLPFGMRAWNLSSWICPRLIP
ncbi:hypothetical protein C5O19_15565 [Siphonobacter curvatus]|uniref:Resolvase/invertase-type recombinase catalytic domain-containing protein n=1 Tax=Siphonobacter curvatus TaxID=2094562 RepID=A0A2S7IJE5_9BACT|nr:hypothetical protein C5O19_15565 [Siphonobacter curvatus]